MLHTMHYWFLGRSLPKTALLPSVAQVLEHDR
jgi:hypothetical protein